MKMAKKMLVFILTATMIAGMMTGIVSADDARTIASGTFGSTGDNLNWTLNNEGTLIISGNGAMWDGYMNTQWNDYKDLIKMCKWRPATAGFAELNGRDAERAATFPL